MSSLRQAKADKSGPAPQDSHPLPYPNNDEHQWVEQMKHLQLQIETHDKVCVCVCVCECECECVYVLLLL